MTKTVQAEIEEISGKLVLATFYDSEIGWYQVTFRAKDFLKPPQVGEIIEARVSFNPERGIYRVGRPLRILPPVPRPGPDVRRTPKPPEDYNDLHQLRLYRRRLQRFFHPPKRGAEQPKR